MNESKFRVDSFWGDVANALLLRPPYREPAQPVVGCSKCNCDCVK